MSATAGAARFLRSGSQARSEGSTSARSARGRGSRRAASPAVAATAPEDDHDELPKGKHSYGTAARTAELQLESARVGKRQALDPIVNAVSGAEAFNGQNYKVNGLAPVEEGDESSLGEVDEYPRTPVPRFVQTPGSSMLSRFSSHFWGPRHPNQGLEDHRSSFRQRPDLFTVKHLNPQKWATSIKSALLMLLLGIFGYSFFYTMNYVSVPKSFLPIKATSPALSNITAHDFKLLKHRLDQVEQYLDNLPAFSTPSDPTPQQQINWFTPGFGAIVDVELSSPTTTFCDPTWKPWPFGSLLRQSCPQLPVSPPHKMAVQPWDDPERERWCAPRSGGKLQLVIEIMRPIMPTELVVEYMAKQASPAGFMGSAPKEIELWVRVEDDDVRDKISEAINHLYPELWEDSSPQKRHLHLKRGLSEEYIPVGRWIYNIYEQSHVQGFRIKTPLLEYGVHTSKVAVRVNSNWGNMEHTCINRFRMHGVDASGFKESLEEGPP